MMIAEQVAFVEPPLESHGLRSRKKERTRLAIQDSALELFARQGYDATSVNEIAQHADVSTTTFFRYFRGKSEVLLNDRNHRLPALQQAIMERPDAEDDLTAIRTAIADEWVTMIDPRRTALQARAIGSSHALRGASYDIGLTWLAAIADVLARRHGLEAPDLRCRVAARTSLATFGIAVDSWMHDDCRGDLQDAVDQAFGTLTDLCHDVTRC